jgi:hypothetical protein
MCQRDEAESAANRIQLATSEIQWSAVWFFFTPSPDPFHDLQQDVAMNAGNPVLGFKVIGDALT